MELERIALEDPYFADRKLFPNRALKSGAVGTVPREFTIFLIYQNGVHRARSTSDFRNVIDDFCDFIPGTDSGPFRRPRASGLGRLGGFGRSGDRVACGSEVVASEPFSTVSRVPWCVRAP